MRFFKYSSWHGTEEIIHVRFLDKELPSHELSKRDFIVILCETGIGRWILIEIQNDDFRANNETRIHSQNSVVLLPIVKMKLFIKM
jgi:hypothetical protein